MNSRVQKPFLHHSPTESQTRGRRAQLNIATALKRTPAWLAILLLILVVGSGFVLHVHASDTETPLSHIFVIMQENHSFDNYFGTYPTGNGTIENDFTLRLQNITGFPKGMCLPLHAGCASPYWVNGSSTANPVEGQLTYENDFDGGRMDGFGRYSGVQSLAYFDYHQVAAYWNYAEEYGLANDYFASALTTTTPNRLLLFTGDSPVSQNYGPPPFVQYNNTIVGQLSAHSVSWGYYDFLSAYGTRGECVSGQLHLGHGPGRPE